MNIHEALTNDPSFFFERDGNPAALVCPRHVTLWQKMLVTMPVTFPLTVLTTSEVYSCLLSMSFLDAISMAQPQVASVYGEGLFETLYKQVLWNIHEPPWLMIPNLAALVCPKTCDTVAEDACNIASHLSIDLTHDKRDIFRQS